MSAISNSSPIAQLQYAQASAAAALMDCLCQLQEQGGYQQMARAIVAGRLDVAQRSYQSLRQRVRKAPTSELEQQAPDELDATFALLGAALLASDDAQAKKLMQTLQQAVRHAHSHHQHSRRKSHVVQALVATESTDGLPAAGAPHINIKV